MVAALEFVSRNSTSAARRLANRVRVATERLTAFPRSGRVVPERGTEDVRELIIAPFRLIYRLVDDDVLIISFYHGARRPPFSLPGEDQ